MPGTDTERPNEIEADIEKRRDELAETLEKLQGRASPKAIAAGAGRALREEGDDLIGQALNMARRSPLAVAVIAAGVAWLAFGPNTAARDGRPVRRRRVRRRPPSPSRPTA